MGTPATTCFHAAWRSSPRKAPSIRPPRCASARDQRDNQAPGSGGRHRVHARAEGHHGEGEGRLRGSPLRFGHVCRHRRCRRDRDGHRARSEADPGRCHQDSRPAHGHGVVALRCVLPDHDRRRSPSNQFDALGAAHRAVVDEALPSAAGPRRVLRRVAARRCHTLLRTVAAMLATHRPQAAHRRRPVAHRVTHSNWP